MILFDDGKAPEPPAKKEEPKREIMLPSLALECESKDRSLSSGDETVYKVEVVNSAAVDGYFDIETEIRYGGAADDKVEWHVGIYVDGHMKWENLHELRHTLGSFEVRGNRRRVIEYHVTAPSGSRFGDSIAVIIMARNKNNPSIQQTVTLVASSRQAFMAIKTQIGQEREAVDLLTRRAIEKKVELSSILNPHPLRGYIIIESMKSDRLIDVVKSVRKTRGIVEGEMSFEDVEKYLTPKAIVAGIHEGDIIELVAGPFKGEKARVQSINEDKEEITVELFEAMVPIPVTVRGDSVRVIDKDKDKVSKNG